MSDALLAQLACPRCGRTDQVQKVSAVVVSGASTSAVVGNTVTAGVVFGPQRQNVPFLGGASSAATTRTQSAVGQRLSPPVPPYRRKPRGTMALIVSLCILGVLSLSFAACTSAIVILPRVSDLSAFVFPGLALLWTLCCFAAAVVAARYHAAEVQRLGLVFAQQQNLWQRAMSKWGQLYYCGRDDVVFIPGQTPPIPAASMMEFIHYP